MAKKTGMFDGADAVYATLVKKGRAKIGAGQFVEEVKGTCVHIVAGKGGKAYAGLHPRKGAVLLNLRMDAPMKSRRVRKVEQISRNRFNCEVLLSAASEVNEEVLRWVKEAWGLASCTKD